MNLPLCSMSMKCSMQKIPGTHCSSCKMTIYIVIVFFLNYAILPFICYEENISENVVC